MKNIGMIMWLLSAVAVAQSEKQTESNITHVTVFLNRAQVTRQVRTRVETGRNVLVVKSLPAGLDPQSIQVRAKNAMVLLGVVHRHSFLNELSLPPSLRKLKDSVAYLNRQLAVEQQFRDALTREEQMLLANQRIGGANQNLTVNELKAMADYFRTRLYDIGIARIQTDEKISALKERLDKLNRQISAQNELLSRNTSEVVISVQADHTGPAELELSYVVSDAGWSPAYDIRAGDMRRPLQVEYKAQVYQRTGEDWNQVRLRLSTGNPSLGGMKPELPVWYVDFFTTPYAKPLAESIKTMRSAPKESEDASIALPATVADYTRTVQTSINTEFDIVLPFTIPSAHPPVQVDIQRFEITSHYRYAAVPKLDGDVFLVAHTTGWDQYSLLPGEAQVFFEGSYVGKTFLQAGEVTDTLTISLGRDPRVVVKREKIRDFTTRGIIGSSVRETTAWQITVRNTRNESIMLRLEDQVPVSRNSQIEVTVSDTGGAHYERDTGKLSWDMTLQPNEVKKVSFRYEIRYPKGRQIVYL
jgi:uncharacterized protein (TIGR02231 family)